MKPSGARQGTESRARSERQLIARADLDALLLDAPAAICVLRGAEHTFELVNERYQQLFPHRNIVGKTIREALAELEGQGFFELLDRVYQTGEPYIGDELPAKIHRQPDGEAEEGFFNFVYQPMRDAGGVIDGVMVFAFEVTELVRSRRRAEELAESLKRVNREKDEFLAVVSHELRTPLTSILGWTRMLKLGGMDAETTTEALDAVERSTKAQASLIEDLLDETRIASGKLRLDVRSIDLLDIVRAATATVAPAAGEKGVGLNTELKSPPLRVAGDPQRLQQVVANVIANAVKFTPSGREVMIEVRGVGSAAVIRVHDEGEGISPELLPFIFDRFRQSSSGERKGGLGLGLSIARHLIELHAGEISAQSDGIGSGATFTIRLPLLRAGAKPPPFIEREASRLNFLPSLEGVRVLVVEDEVDIARIISAVLQRCGAEVLGVATAAEAFAEVRRWKPSVIVSDIVLPLEDGCSMMTRIRALRPEEGGQTPAIALTVHGRPDDRSRVLASGFQIFRQKPIEPSDLAHDIARLAGVSGAS